jgi:hypothetical protein
MKADFSQRELLKIRVQIPGRRLCNELPVVGQNGGFEEDRKSLCQSGLG